MYSTKELTKYDRSRETLDKQWGYRIWKGYELMCVNEVGCKSSQEAVIAARKEIGRGLICRFCL